MKRITIAVVVGFSVYGRAALEMEPYKIARTGEILIKRSHSSSNGRLSKAAMNLRR